MAVIRRGGPWTAAPLIFALLVTSLMLSTPASATTDDIFSNALGHRTSSTGSGFSGCTGTNRYDGDDSTGDACTDTAGNPSFGSNLDASYGIHYVHVKVNIGGTTAFTNFELELNVGATCVWSTRTGTGCTQNAGGGWAPGTHDTGVVDLGTTVTSNNFGFTAFTVGSGGTFILTSYAIEGWTSDPTGPTSVPIGTYCYNMKVTHPQFAWAGSCRFASSFEGTITFTTDPAGGSFHVGATGNTTYTTTVSLTPTGGFGTGAGNAFIAGIDFSQDCFPLCQSDHVTMVILDTTNNQTASFTFDRSADGLVQVPTWLPVFISYSGCYNASTNQCGHSSASGTTDIAWAWRCNAPASEPDCSGSDSTVKIGPLSPATGGFQATRYSVDTPGQAAGSYTAYGLTTSTTQNKVWVIQLRNAFGTTRGSVTLDFTSGGNADTYQEPAQGETCGALDLGCALRQFFNVAAGSVVSLVTDAVDEIHDAALTRQPFNFIVRAFDGVSAQLARATAEVTTSSTCSGYTLTMPTPPPVKYNTPTATMTVQTWPSAMPAPSFVVLKCADLEPWGGTSWWQAIRGAMDPAIYLAWGYSQLRRLQPHVVIGA